MLRLLLVLLVSRNCLSYPKCCDSDSVFEKSDDSYKCTQDVNKRTQISANRTNFVEDSEDGYCVEVEDSVGLFRSNGSDLSKVKDLDVDFYPKCCPLGYFYNGTIHGCVESGNATQPFFGESYVKVGLPHCKIIEDLKVNVNGHLERLNNGSLHLHEVYQDGQYCVDKDENDLFVVRICHSDFSVCDKIRCIRKCCPDGQSFINGSRCHNTFIRGLDISSYGHSVDNVNDSFAIVHDGFSPPLYPLVSQFKFHLDTAGVFTMSEVVETLGRINITRSYSVEEKIYCAEHGHKGKMNDYFFFRGFPPQIQSKYVYSGSAMIISCFFLVLTILYYCLSPEKKTLFGKILIGFCATSLLLFILLSYFAFNYKRPKNGSPWCIVYGFTTIYLSLSTFAWMNVMCIDIYCTFGSSRSFASRQYGNKDLKRFLLYSLHGWGTPLFLVILQFVFYSTDVLPFALKIIIDEKKCFLHKGDNNYALFVFYAIPMALVQLSNLILFVKTSLYCLQVKREINKMNDTHALKGERRQKINRFRDRFGLLLKLFFIMGISFLFEVVSSFYDFKRHESTAIIEIIWDTFNCLQGLFIFLIFIMKRRIFQKFQKRVGLQKMRKISLASLGMTQTTSVPSLGK